MKRKPTVALLYRVMMSLFTLLFVGCTTTVTYDQLPNNVPIMLNQAMVPIACDGVREDGRKLAWPAPEIVPK